MPARLWASGGDGAIAIGGQVGKGVVLVFNRGLQGWVRMGLKRSTEGSEVTRNALMK